MAPYTIAFCQTSDFPLWATVIFSRLVRLPSLSMLAPALSQVRPPCKTTWNSRHKIPSGLAVCTPATQLHPEMKHHIYTKPPGTCWYPCCYLCQTMSNLNLTGWGAQHDLCMPENSESFTCLMPSTFVSPSWLLLGVIPVMIKVQEKSWCKTLLRQKRTWPSLMGTSISSILRNEPRQRICNRRSISIVWLDTQGLWLR